MLEFGSHTNSDCHRTRRSPASLHIARRRSYSRRVLRQFLTTRGSQSFHRRWRPSTSSFRVGQHGSRGNHSRPGVPGPVACQKVCRSGLPQVQLSRRTMKLVFDSTLNSQSPDCVRLCPLPAYSTANGVERPVENLTAPFDCQRCGPTRKRGREYFGFASTLEMLCRGRDFQGSCQFSKRDFLKRWAP